MPLAMLPILDRAQSFGVEPRLDSPKRDGTQEPNDVIGLNERVTVSKGGFVIGISLASLDKPSNGHRALSSQPPVCANPTGVRASGTLAEATFGNTRPVRIHIERTYR